MRSDFADKEGYVSSLYSTGYAFIYNTGNVRPLKFHALSRISCILDGREDW
jgi:hypothetical protein